MASLLTSDDAESELVAGKRKTQTSRIGQATEVADVSVH